MESSPRVADELDELADLVEDLLAWTAWEGSRGAWALPRGDLGDRPAPGARPPPARSTPSPSRAASPSRATVAEGAPAASAPGAASASPAVPASRSTPVPGARQASNPARAGFPIPPAPPPAPPPGAQGLPAPPGRASGEDAWARIARSEQPVGRALQEALRAAIQHPTAAQRLDAVREVLGDCLRCGLGPQRRSLVFGVGDPDAPLVVIGEGPGEQEDRRGEPFVGPAGEMLDNMLERVLGLRRQQVYILNMVKCRPPGNRNPEPEEVQACRPFLRAQLASIRPRFALVLGSVACRALFDRPVSAVRGQPQDLYWPGGQTTALPTFHPAYLLRKPEDKRLALEDLRSLKALMGAPASG